MTTPYDHTQAAIRMVQDAMAKPAPAPRGWDKIEADATHPASDGSFEQSVKVWICPVCSFAMDAVHANRDGSFTCPACSETQLLDTMRRNERCLLAAERMAAAVRLVLPTIKHNKKCAYWVDMNTTPKFAPECRPCDCVRDILPKALAAYEEAGKP